MGEELTEVTIDIRTDSDFRATEIVADLRNAAEILYFPLKSVGFWDGPTGGHICPQLQRGQECPHCGKSGEEALAEYVSTVENELRGVVEVSFPHADVHIFLG